MKTGLWVDLERELKLFCDSTSIHGLYYFGTKSNVNKLVWIIALLCLTVWMSHDFLDLVSNWQQKSTMIMIENPFFPTNNIQVLKFLTCLYNKNFKRI